MADYRGSLKITYPDSSATLVINKGKVAVDGKGSAKSALSGGHEMRSSSSAPTIRWRSAKRRR